ncbi:DNA mismatch repair protein MSH3 [Impatiens glandulifera]|uniref:DNA mismatch repair protein MSH3 n=1 Tax=Impatiens glandulifera TaxID=253017 RepID=UPI001FB05E3B|nr:DNA mismatch repair protein MSH3 [Impatiens glandulifera]
MAKQKKQQVISRFFSPKVSTSSSSPSPVQTPASPSPKISAVVSFSPAKRLQNTLISIPNPKPSKSLKLDNECSQRSEPSKCPHHNLSPHTQNPIPPLPNPTLHQRFLQKLLEPPKEETRESFSSNQNYTPLEQQIVDLKSKYPDVLLMVEVGYRYRFFGEDAEAAARVLGIYAHMNHNFLTASIPTFRLNVHLRRLVGAGYKVGVVKQTETAAIKAHGSNRLGPFCRGLSALYTKATLEASEDIEGSEEGCGQSNNYLVCVVEKELAVENVKCGTENVFDVRIGIVAVEISTGDVVHGDFNDNFLRSGLEAIIMSLSPAELLIGNPLSKQTEKLLLAYAGPASNIRVERTSKDRFCDGGALAEVLSLYETVNDNTLIDHEQEENGLEDQSCDRAEIKEIMAISELAIQAFALLVNHLKQFGFERILCSGASFRPLTSKMEMTLSANALQQLQIFKNSSDGSESGSLMQCLNHTLTIFGSRLLRHWISHPLCEQNLICARLDAVSEIADSMASCGGASYKICNADLDDSDVRVAHPRLGYLLSSVLTSLGRSLDIQRGITRIFHQTANVSEFVTVIQAILDAGKQLQQLPIEEMNEGENGAIHSALLKKLILAASSSSLISNAATLLSCLNKEAAYKGDLPNIFITSSEQFPEVEKAQTSIKVVEGKLSSSIGAYRKQLKMRNLEFICVSGVTHLIEIPSDVKVPSNWVKVNSTKKTVRYHPPEVLSTLNQLSLAKEELAAVSRSAWEAFLKAFGKYYAEFHSAIQALATLDCLHSLAFLSRNKNYVRPIFVKDTDPVQIQICSGRNPILETLIHDSVVPNDTHLHAGKECCQIVTGPNMGGKSCYIRQVGLICIMAQIGSFVPAASANLHVLDGIYTRIGASDSIQKGRSTFFEELSEASSIIHNCTARSLVIIDELGRGTSTHDGVAIAYATLHYLLQEKKCMILFVTHYPKIVEIKNEFIGSVAAYHVSYMTSQNKMESKEQKGEKISQEMVTYLYKLVPGATEKTFGHKVAQLAQLPDSCIDRAVMMSARMEKQAGMRGKDHLEMLFKTTEESAVSEEEDEAKPIYSFHARPDDALVDSYMDFFSNINSAMKDDDFSKSLHFLKNAQKIGIELVQQEKKT